MLVAFLGYGQMWGAEQLAYTLTPASGSNNSYTGNCDVAISGITWNLEGNSQQQPWRLGGNQSNCNGVNRSVYSKTAMSNAITKVELKVGGASSITVNSLKLIVASNADFSTVIDEVTETFIANSTITFTPTSPATDWATGAYYKFVFNLKVTASSGNKFVAFSEAKFYKEVATETCETPTISPAAGTFYGTQEITLATNTAGASIYYTTNGSTPSSTNGTLYEDPFEISTTTTVKAIAIKTGATDSQVAEAVYTAGTPVSTFDIDFEKNNLTAYINWNFVNIACATSTITAHGGTYYGNTDGKASASITTKEKYANPGLLTFYTSKESGNTNASSWIVQVSEDGEDWTTAIATFDATTGDKGTWTAREADLSGHTNVYVRIAYSGSTAVRAIDNISLANATEIAKPTISGDEIFLTNTEISIACSTGEVTIYYTDDNTDPKTSLTKKTYSAPFSVAETTTIRAIANKGAAWSAEATSMTFTKITPITVAAAIAAIPNKNDVVDDQYVSGIVCTAGASVNSGKMTYYISDDGSETNRLQIYKGKNVGNTNFSAASDLAIGDRVVVFGQLKNYNNTPEMNDGNYLISKEDPAVAIPVFNPNGGGFMGETDVTITCATAGNAIYYTLDGSAPSKLSTLYESAIHLNATTTITAIAYVDEEHSVVVAKTFTLTAPMTIAEALTALDSEDPINNAAVSGIISTAPSSNPSSGKLTYYISDDGSDTDELEVFLGFGLNGASFSNKTDLQVGDEVTVFGNLTIYNNTTKEFASGSRLLEFNRPEVAVTSIELTESTAEVEEGSTVILHAAAKPDNATNKAINWSVQSGSDYASVNENGVVTGVAAGEAVIRAASAADATKYAECTVTVNAADPTKHAVTFDATVDMGESPLSKSNITLTCSNGVLNNGNEYRLYKNSTTTFACSDGNITKIEFTGVSGNPVSGFGDPETGTLVTEGNNGVWTGNAASISFVASGAQVRATEIVVTYKEDDRDAAGLAWNTDAVELTVGDAFTAPTLSNPNSIDASAITIASNNTDLATVNEGVVSLVANATGEATITATFAGNDDYKPATVSYTITVNAPAPIVTGTIYRKVTSTADITNGDYLIVYEGDADHDAFAFNGSLDNVDQAKKGVAVTINEGVIAGTPELDAAVFTINVTAGTLKSASGLYIGKETYANGMDKSETTEYVNTFAITNDEAVITGAGGCTLRYNYAVDQLRFRYYKSDQQKIQLYKRDAYTRTVTEGRYGTICLPRAGKMVGASIYEIAYFGQASNKVFFDEIVNGEMVAGMPYVFLPNENVTELKVVYTSTTEAEEAQSNNGLHGTLSAMTDILASDNIYLVYQNQILHSTVDGSTLAANRAYIKLGEIDPQEPALAPGRRRVSMGVQGEQVATAIDGLNATEVPVKVLINGQLFILRGEKMYDTTGRLVK